MRAVLTALACLPRHPKNQRQELMTTNERRRAVRAPAKLAMQIKLGGGARGTGGASGETINVSANGVYFSTPTHIAPLTKLQITLILPETERTSSGKAKEVVCDGIVVRSEPDDPTSRSGPYEIACYFTSISPRDREDLEAYILNQLAF
jgi:c-di-GMP-binding flagellar brake protein YcgR